MEELRSCQSWKFGIEILESASVFLTVEEYESVTIRSGLRYASGFSSTAFTTLNSVVEFWCAADIVLALPEPIRLQA